MKYIKAFRFALIAVALSLASCQNEELVSSLEQEQLLEIVTATQHGTRTSLAENGQSVVWNEGDAIAVYDFNVPKHKFVAEINDGTTRFAGKITPRYSSFIAAYPYDLSAEQDVSRKIVMTLPAEQTAVLGSFGANLNLSIAKGERNIDGSPSKVSFRNVCQLLKLTIPSYINNRVTRIEFATTKAIVGQLTVDYSGDAPSVVTDESGAQSITLLPPSGATTFAEGAYYMVLAPVQFEGFTIKLTDANGKVYTQHSTAVLGGDRGMIYNLGAMDLIDVPVVTSRHIYANSVLQGTEITLTAPVSDKDWSAVVKNAAGTAVRTITAATGTLTSNHTDDAWPYLPQGNYTVEYNYTTANGKQRNATTTFAVTEKPAFSLALSAKSTYSYYQEGNIDKANGMDASTVDNINLVVSGISSEILTNGNYAVSRTNSFNGTEKSYSSGTAVYENLSISNVGSSELSATVVFDGVSKTASTRVHITGLPFRHNPPTTQVWSKSGDVTNEGDHALFGRWSAGSQSLTYSAVNIPAGTKLNLDYKFTCFSEPVSTTMTISAGDQTLISGGVSGTAGKKAYEGRESITLNNQTTQIRCHNSYGAGLTYTQLFLVGLSYRN